MQEGLPEQQRPVPVRRRIRRTSCRGSWEYRTTDRHVQRAVPGVPEQLHARVQVQGQERQEEPEPVPVAARERAPEQGQQLPFLPRFLLRSSRRTSHPGQAAHRRCGSPRYPVPGLAGQQLAILRQVMPRSSGRTSVRGLHSYRIQDRTA
jgi:hypothetical protein